jgi:hypothetical protein
MSRFLGQVMPDFRFLGQIMLDFSEHDHRRNTEKQATYGGQLLFDPARIWLI